MPAHSGSSKKSHYLSVFLLDKALDRDRSLTKSQLNGCVAQSVAPAAASLVLKVVK